MKLLPLLGGKVEVEEITLRDPVITVLKNAQGQLNVSTPCQPQARSSPRNQRHPGSQWKSASSPVIFAVDPVSIRRRKLTDRLHQSTSKPTEYTVNDLDSLRSVHLDSRLCTPGRNCTTLQPSGATTRSLGSSRENSRPEIIQLQP